MLPADAQQYDLFGVSTALQGDVAVLGSIGDDDRGPTSGAAYVYRRTGSTWVPTFYVKASNSAASDFFGSSIAVSGELAVCGASSEDSTSSQPSRSLFWRKGVCPLLRTF